MDGFGLVCTILSMLLMMIFNFICIRKYGLLSCYSAYGEKWETYSKEHNISNTNIWSIVTIVSAMLLVPPALVTGEGNNFQFLCFFMPLYLFLVGLTPNYNVVHKVIHVLGAGLCMLSMLIWLLFIVHQWFILLPVTVLAMIISMGTRTLESSWLYYLEMIFYLTGYITLLTF